MNAAVQLFLEELRRRVGEMVPLVAVEVALSIAQEFRGQERLSVEQRADVIARVDQVAVEVTGGRDA
ncbi:hypothetical protein HNR42_001336 [Deinobacterium chartae]|uniref:Uncharacterized protein n=1 Tax=Deinobacterium chartae TaxID=521158 RepID=A0A841HYF6_9DEIO|nr:hypothetical protein [Deinobacterium chartae]MBB6097913.1 hypothetical protein [Deinobacterium chartae]